MERHSLEIFNIDHGLKQHRQYDACRADRQEKNIINKEERPKKSNKHNKLDTENV